MLLTIIFFKPKIKKNVIHIFKFYYSQKIWTFRFQYLVKSGHTFGCPYDSIQFNDLIRLTFQIFLDKSFIEFARFKVTTNILPQSALLSDDRQPQLVNPMSMSGAHGGGVDMGDPNCGHTIEHPVDEGQVAAYHHQQNQSEQQHPGGAGDLSRRLPSGLVNAKGQMQGPMSMVRCNIMGKPPPPLPHMTRVAIDGPPPPILGNSQPQLQQRYSNQWWILRRERGRTLIYN